MTQPLRLRPPWDAPAPPPRALSPLEAEFAARLRPDADLVARVALAREHLVERATALAKELGVPLRKALVAGSSARETYLPGRLDLDFFLLFDPSLPREKLSESGLALAHRLLEAPERRYAEHPYARGRFEGFMVDAVPGYLVERSDAPISAVDRTPFHHAFLSEHLPPERHDDVRLLKRFLTSLGVYGAEVRTEGVSGYSTELLVVLLGSFPAVVKAAAGWWVPQRLCPEGPEPSVMADAALVLPDPVDPHRNVTSALSRRNLSVLILGAREYLARPRAEFFDPPAPPALTAEEMESRIRPRGSTLIVLLLDDPGKVPDILWPQMRKVERSSRELLERLGFTVLATSSATAGGRIAVLVETDRSELSPVRVHRGPPVGAREASHFLERWQSSPGVLRGPYVSDDGRLWVEIPQEPTGILPVTNAALSELSVGKDLREPLARSAGFVPLAEARGEPAALLALAELVDRRLPWVRWGVPHESAGKPVAAAPRGHAGA